MLLQRCCILVIGCFTRIGGTAHRLLSTTKLGIFWFT
ncbi:unnamed protein product, partial [Allacma fusca]